MDDTVKPVEQNITPTPVPAVPVEPPKTDTSNVAPTSSPVSPTTSDDFYSSGYVPKPGGVIRPQHLINEENLASRVDTYKAPSVNSNSNVPSDVTFKSYPVGASNETLTSISNVVATENQKTNTGPVPFPNPFDDPNSIDAAALKAKADDLKKAGVGVVKSAKFKKIMFITIGSILGILVLIIGFNILWPILFPPKEEIVAPPIIAPPVVREEPKEDKTSLKYLDGKVRELKPSLDELNNDSLFMLELKLEDSDFEKNAGL